MSVFQCRCIIVNFTLFFLLHLRSPEFLHQVVMGFDWTGHSDQPLQLSSNVQQFPHRRGTYVVQTTILFPPQHHLPE